MRSARHPLAVVVLVAALGGCSTPIGATAQGGVPTAVATPSPIPSSIASSGTGISAESSSTALPLQARDLRLVRVGANEVALQFEFANNADRPVTPDTWASTSTAAS